MDKKLLRVNVECCFFSRHREGKYEILLTVYHNAETSGTQDIIGEQTGEREHFFRGLGS